MQHLLKMFILKFYATITLKKLYFIVILISAKENHNYFHFSKIKEHLLQNAYFAVLLSLKMLCKNVMQHAQNVYLL